MDGSFIYSWLSMELQWNRIIITYILTEMKIIIPFSFLNSVTNVEIDLQKTILISNCLILTCHWIGFTGDTRDNYLVSIFHLILKRHLFPQEISMLWSISWSRSVRWQFHKDNNRHLSLDSQISLLPLGFSPHSISDSVTRAWTLSQI